MQPFFHLQILFILFFALLRKSLIPVCRLSKQTRENSGSFQYFTMLQSTNRKFVFIKINKQVKSFHWNVNSFQQKLLTYIRMTTATSGLCYAFCPSLEFDTILNDIIFQPKIITLMTSKADCFRLFIWRYWRQP